MAGAGGSMGCMVWEKRALYDAMMAEWMQNR